jgi:hypothetical protein
MGVISFFNSPMFVTLLRNPEKVLAIQRSKKEHIAGFLLYLAGMKLLHLIGKSVLCLA